MTIPYGVDYTCSHGEPWGYCPRGCEPDTREAPIDRLRAMLLDSAGLDGLPVPRPLIRGVLQTDSLAWLVGRPGSAKTFIALDMTGSVGTGLSWQGHPVTAGPALYVIAEGAHGIRPRVRAWESSAGRPMTGVAFLPAAVQAGNTGQWDALCVLAAEQSAALVVIDTQARVTVGLEENSARDMGVFVDRLEALRAASGACVLVLHHTPRNGDHMRGSTAMEGAATTILVVKKEGASLTLSNDPEDGGKQKDAEPIEPIYLRLVASESSAIVTATDRPQGMDLDSGAVRDMLARWWQWHGSDLVSVAVLVKSGACAERTFHRYKKALINAGLVLSEGRGNQIRYRLMKDPDS